MGFRALATAIAVWCVSGAAMAGGYTEVWNPPEISGHAAKHGVAKAPSGSGSKGVSKTVSKHATPPIASASDRSDKSGTRGGAKQVASKSAHQAPDAGGAKPRPKAAIVAQSKKPHAQLIHTKPGQAKPMHANFMQGKATHAGPIKAAVAAKGRSEGAKPAVVETKAPAPFANAAVEHTEATANPAMARSGSLPPILH
ncbi:hypothetical protein [Paraburkholderia rhynchosiae]|uniref:Uncharacterized protein n=1 Tax=Paraburkholderia rhynchosiae TaxID=487049 RepID=A0A2N7WAK4_9BURK|nr:hypothetical protein [Paraburkholderia rhynchosiae]PMS26427.1 hypothetical protein C0Z16_26940 [Paraburkholderia rhynchosiae]CAB3715922.1 hypothetical protein LMG27174_04551 [Paraburkholderia rhynchosiae]